MYISLSGTFFAVRVLSSISDKKKSCCRVLRDGEREKERDIQYRERERVCVSMRACVFVSVCVSSVVPLYF